MLLHWIDLIGTFIFAISGAVAGIRREFDIFGVFVAAAITAVGGGIIRDVCIGYIPPAGLVDGAYLTAIILAVIPCVFAQSFIVKMDRPTLWVDAVGLGFFAAFGADKTYQHTGNIEISVILGCISAVGGGCMRDILTGRPPIIFSKEIYGCAAIIGAGIALLGSTNVINPSYSIWIAIIVCTTIRIVSMQYHINLPIIAEKVKKTPK